MTPPAPRLADAGHRRRAVTLFDRNIVVTAGAGTGKTALLVERALNLIGSGRSEIGSMALITFTEKAAAELRQRLASGLDTLRRHAAARTPLEEIDPGTDAARSYAWLCGVSDQAHEEVAARALQALTEVDTAAVATIHAFCAEILRRYPREAGSTRTSVSTRGRCSSGCSRRSGNVSWRRSWETRRAAANSGSAPCASRGRSGSSVTWA